MSRTTISLTPELQEKLRREAARRGVSMATLIRESVESLNRDDRTPALSHTKSVRNGHDSTAAEAEVVSEGSMRRVLEALPADTKKRVLQAAKQLGDSPEHFVWLAIEDKTAFVRPKPSFLASASSEYTDTSILAGETRPVPRSI